MLLLKYFKFLTILTIKNLSEQEEEKCLDKMDDLWYKSSKFESLIIRYVTRFIYKIKHILKRGRGVHSKEFNNESPKISA